LGAYISVDGLRHLEVQLQNLAFIRKVLVIIMP